MSANHSIITPDELITMHKNALKAALMQLDMCLEMLDTVRECVYARADDVPTLTGAAHIMGHIYDTLEEMGASLHPENIAIALEKLKETRAEMQ